MSSTCSTYFVELFQTSIFYKILYPLHKGYLLYVKSVHVSSLILYSTYNFFLKFSVSCCTWVWSNLILHTYGLPKAFVCTVQYSMIVIDNMYSTYIIILSVVSKPTTPTTSRSCQNIFAIKKPKNKSWCNEMVWLWWCLGRQRWWW